LCLTLGEEERPRVYAKKALRRNFRGGEQKKEEAGENYIMRGSVIHTLHQISSGPSNEGPLDRWCILHA
jgi:hypothetical protein